MSGRLGVQLLAGALLAAVPPLVAFAVTSEWAVALGNNERAALRLLLLGLTVMWVGMVAMIGTRYLSLELRNAIALTESREPHPLPGTGNDRLAELLIRHDRQLQTLATHSAAAPIADGPSAVAMHVVHTAREVSGDQTWQLVVHDGSVELAPGAYGPEMKAPHSITDLHRWAATVAGDRASSPAVRTGPWGAFLLLGLHSEGVRALLMAPWEGRPEPSGAERALLALVAEHAATALAHAVLYSRVRDQADDLARLSAIQKDFLRGVTHDLQSPLASIQAMASELRQGHHSLGTGEFELRAIEHHAERLRRMVSQLLTMSGIEAGVVAPRADVFRSEPIVSRVVGSTGAERERFSITTSGPDRLVVGDPDRLEQAVWAVIDNAIKYSEPSSPIDITLSVEEAQGMVTELIKIRDRGIGMSQDERSRAADQFYRSDRARMVAPNGSGIGLYTASHLLALMGGALTLESRLSEGTTACLRMPAELTGAREAPTESTKALDSNGRAL